MVATEKRWLKHYPENISKEIDIPIQQMLKDTAAKFPDNEAISFFTRKMTYREVLQLSIAFASALQANGLKKGDRVAIMLPNCPHYIISYYGILMAGGIVTQVNPMLVGRELSHILNDSGAEMIVIFEPLLPVLQQVENETPVKKAISVNFPESAKDVAPAVTFEAFMSQATGQVKEPNINPAEDVAVLQYTGGTTGRSKGAMLTHRNLVANVHQTYRYFESEFNIGEDRVLTVIPLFHVYGMTSCMNLSIYTGAANILLPRFDLQEVLETIKREQPTTFPGVPTMYIAITSHPEAEKYGINSIRTCNSGSAPMPVESMRAFEKKTGAVILEGYGLSETSPTTHCNPVFAERKPGSVGIGIPSTDYKIVDLETGTKELPIGESGEIIIKGPQVMKGYWNMPEETEQALRDGWLYTGDIGKMDEDGYLYIIDRKKDMIIASGYNIYPRDVEEVIYEHPAVQEAVVVGVPDPYRGETVKAVIVLKEGQSVTEEEMLDYCRQHLAAYKAPKLIEFRKELPKTAVGKILRRTIKEEERKKYEQQQS
ncbi:long-chain fatty acid--CoA ligase [Pueribacillus theae]|uniref:Long-chain fatty acid--CoA ligase n=1 Tax=Pueribacillus theae TaxID=2171751 RepID=A0A2U1K3Z1_9BACI|nr:long-chain fatty acid--CoA ligase [Pueribacillus theae]PWA11975.1 long-chain fatty acid--CoA ligase [Pueribacillus theae]